MGPPTFLHKNPQELLYTGRFLHSTWFVFSNSIYQFPSEYKFCDYKDLVFKIVSKCDILLNRISQLKKGLCVDSLRRDTLRFKTIFLLLFIMKID